MKKNIFVLLFFFACVPLFAETLDSLKANRETLYQKYSEINIPGKELSDADIAIVVGILKDLIIIDTRIIKEFGNSDKEAQANALKIKELISENDLLKKDKESTTDFLFLIYIASGVIVSLLIFSIVFLFLFYSKFSKLRKKLMEYNTQQNVAEDYRLKWSKMNELLSLKENEIEKLGQQIQIWKNEKSVMEGKLQKLEEYIGELQKTKQNRSSGEVVDEEKLNIQMAKIEKLGKMKELGIVTEEEFNTFRQKFLNEM